MKKLIILSTLIFTLIFSSTASFAEWKKVSKGMNGNIYYVDFSRIKKHGGYVYYWRLSDFLKPTEHGDLSARVYHQVDCKLFRFKRLSYVFHKQPMGKGIPVSNNPKNPDWDYSPPNSIDEEVLQAVCKFGK